MSKSNKKIPLRMCIACRQMKPKKELIRIVSIGENHPVVDSTGKKNGRGAYLCKDNDCIDKAKKTNLIERTFNVKCDQSVFEQLEEQTRN